MAPFVLNHRISASRRSWVAWSCAASLLAASPFVRADDTPPATAPPPTLAPETAAPSTTDAPNPPPPGLAPEPPAAKTEAESKPPNETAEPAAAPTPTPSEAAPPAATAQTESPPPAENSSDARQDNIIEAKHEGRVPYFQTVRPAWAFEMTGSIGALGNTPIEASQPGNLTRAIELQPEYQPPFMQGLGVFSFGPSISIYGIGPGLVTPNLTSVWGVGGQVRYQARFFREQPVVPMVGFEGQQLTYHFTDGAEGATSIEGAYFGLMILLNFIEPSAASELYIENGIARSYLVAEYKMLSGGDESVTVGNGSFYFGLRLEF